MTSKTQELFGTIWNGSGTVPDSKPIARGTVRNGSGDLHNIAILLTYIVVYLKLILAFFNLYNGIS